MLLSPLAETHRVTWLCQSPRPGHWAVGRPERRQGPKRSHHCLKGEGTRGFDVSAARRIECTYMELCKSGDTVKWRGENREDSG